MRTPVCSTWDDQPPAGVSYCDHLKLLPVAIIDAWSRGGRRGSLYVSPEVAARLDAIDGFGPLALNSGACGCLKEPVLIGYLAGIPLWVDVLQMMDTVYVAEHVTAPQDAVLQVINGYFTRKSLLDTLAEASREP